MLEQLPVLVQESSQQHQVQPRRNCVLQQHQWNPSWPIHHSKAEAATSVEWTTDPAQLLAILQSEASFKVVFLGANGDVTTTLYEVPREHGWLTAPMVSPDGRFLAFTQRSYISDLVWLENF